MTDSRKSCCGGSMSDDPYSYRNPELQKRVVGLVGNPNSGKTTVFNGLTGARQRVGNWPGVTVERKSGFFTCQDVVVEVVDLPGTYSLTIASESSSIDERIACEFILNRCADVIVNVLDASNLERNLYLTLQLLEMQVPVVLAVNMMDVATNRELRIQLDVLQNMLDLPVVSLSAHKGCGIDDLKKLLTKNSPPLQRSWRGGPGRGGVPTTTESYYAPAVMNAINTLSSHLTETNNTTWLAIRLLEDDMFARQLVTPAVLETVQACQQQIRTTLNEDADILIADARYRFIQQIISRCVIQNSQKKITWTERLDRVLLNRILGIPIFLSVMYFMFFFAINIGGAFQDFFDIGSDTIFVGGFSQLLTQWHFPTWLIAILANGIGKGINTTITFIPVIGAMFLFLAFLEDSGYMARAAFVVDRVMRALGLPGKSFVPMIVGFGCNVPAVMAARTLENKRDRILTVMMTPFMSCGARLAIFAVFTTAFFPKGGQNVVFALYMIGVIAAMLTGLLLRKTLLKGDPAPLVMELPVYHVPTVKTVLLHAWQRLKGFVFRAGKLIVPICVLIGVLNALNINGTINAGDGDANSLLSALGKMMTPVFAPMGIHQDNWPATVGLVTGVLAKEVVIGTLNTIYSQVGHFAQQADAFNFWGGLHDAVMSIPLNLSQLGSSMSNPVLAKAPVHTLTQSVYGLMYQRFDGQLGAMAYLLFVLLYFPCVSTTAVMLRELHRGWTIFSVLWTTGLAYCVAVGFYQAATFARHPVSSATWIAAVVSVVLVTILCVRSAAEISARQKNLPLEAI